MDIRQIPGYYYDKDKKKYFKIQAGTSISAYSSRDVKRRQMEEAEAEASLYDQARQRDRIKRSKVLTAPLGGGLLSRESGVQRLDLISQIAADGVIQQSRLVWSDILHGNKPSIFTIQSQHDIGPSIVDYHVSNENELITIRGNTERGTPEDTDYVRRLVFNRPGASTSVNVHEETQKVLMTWLAGSDNSGIGLASVNFEVLTQGIEAQAQPAIQLGPGISRGAEVSVYGSAPAPPQSSVLFAIGTSHGLLKIDKESCDLSWITPKLPRYADEDSSGFPRDTFALDFMSNDPSVLLCGGRRGILNITDLRIPVFGEKADTIRHPSSITHIKQLDDHRIIVAGLNSSLCQYDLRFRKLDTQLQGSWPRTDTPTTHTLPLLRYPNYYNSSILSIGFDVDLETGLVAAAQQSKSGWGMAGIHLYSLHTGRLLRSIGKEEFGLGRMDEADLPLGGWIQCMKFARDSDRKTKSLYLGSSFFQDVMKFSL